MLSRSEGPVQRLSTAHSLLTLGLLGIDRIFWIFLFTFLGHISLSPLEDGSEFLNFFTNKTYNSHQEMTLKQISFRFVKQATLMLLSFHEFACPPNSWWHEWHETESIKVSWPRVAWWVYQISWKSINWSKSCWAHACTHTGMGRHLYRRTNIVTRYH